MHLLINPLHPSPFQPPHHHHLSVSPFVLQRCSLQQIWKVRYHISATCCWGCLFFVFTAVTVIYHCLGGLRCRRRIIIDDNTEFLFPEQNTFKNTNFFGNYGSSPTNTEGNTAEGCQRASLMVCRCHIVKPTISHSQDSAHPSWTAWLIFAFSFLVSWSDNKIN